MPEEEKKLMKKILKSGAGTNPGGRKTNKKLS